MSDRPNVFDLASRRGERAPEPQGEPDIIMPLDGDSIIFRDQDALDAYVLGARAEALREAADEAWADSRVLREAYRAHNAGRSPDRPRCRPDLDTWASADEARSHKLRQQADQIEGGDA